MGLTKAQRRKLTAQGFSSKDIADIDAQLDDDDDDDEGGGRRRARGSGTRRVFVLQGREADDFLASIGGNGEGTDDEGEDDDDADTPKRRRRAKASEGDEGEDDDESDADADEKPPAGHKYFRG
jgi:hypothetical protein